MKLENMTAKTLTLEAEPGERYGMDNDGFCIQRITLRWDGNEDLKSRLLAAIREQNRVQEIVDEIDDDTYYSAIHCLDSLIDFCIETLPRCCFFVHPDGRVQWVWTGHSF